MKRVAPLVAMAAAIWIMAALLHHYERLPERHLAQCVDNLRVIEQALTRYAAANHGRFPPRLAGLTPEYLPGPLTCPAAGENSYTWQLEDGQITVICWGVNHFDAQAQPDCPRLCIPPGGVEARGPEDYDLQDP